MKEAGMARHTREFANELSQLAGLRAFILTECRRAWGAHAEDALDQLMLAVQEAATNILRHGYRDEGRRPIRLAIEIEPDRVHLAFIYPGRHFDPEKVLPPVFDGSREGGFGVYLIRQLVDEVRYTRDSEGMCGIHLVKKRHPVSSQEH
jgi:serine/threonine-protein kinase RsbW